MFPRFHTIRVGNRGWLSTWRVVNSLAGELGLEVQCLETSTYDIYVRITGADDRHAAFLRHFKAQLVDEAETQPALLAV
jgi:hypothetical protein